MLTVVKLVSILTWIKENVSNAMLDVLNVMQQDSVTAVWMDTL